MSSPADDTPERPTGAASTAGSAAATAGEGTPPYGWAALTAGLVFALYAVTLAPTTAFWDTSEYIATGHILGIPHPPGNPLFVILARTWDILLSPLDLSTAVRINLFSATMSALAHGLWFLVAHRILSYFSRRRAFRLTGAFVAVLISATAFTVWNQSNVNEKVYTVSLFTIALLTWLAFLWRGNLGEGKDDNLLVLMVFILALSVGNHLMAFLAAPGLGIYVLLVHPETLLNRRLYVAALVVGLLGLSVHLFLPLRAGLDPVINEADPTCRSFGSAVTSVVTYGQAGCEELSAALARQQYDKPPLIPRQANLAAQYGNYFQYFDWQWARSLQGTETLFALARLPFTLLFTFLGIYGAVEHYRRDKPSFAYVATLFATLSVALVFYLNFRYGYTFPSPGQGMGDHEVRERDYFFIVSFSVWGVWAGVGLSALWQQLSEKVDDSLAKSAPLLAVALLPLALNWSWATRAYDYSARDWAYNLLQSVEPYGILFTNGDNDTFPLWYLQEVENIREDVTVIVTSYLNTDWYVKQLRELTRPCGPDEDPADHPTRIICQRPYRGVGTGAVYAADSTSLADDAVPLVLDREVTPAADPILALDDETIDRVTRSYVQVDQTRTYRLGNVRATVQAGQYLLPWHQFALAIISNSIGQRPIYFASSGNSAESLGLGDYLIRQGLAFKLHNGSLSEEAAPEGVAPVRAQGLRPVTGPWVDGPRTRKLVEDVFVHRSDLPAWDHWPDHSTIGIPNYYAWSYYALAQVAAERGAQDALQRYRERGDAWAELGGAGSRRR